jgi:hypothetical protein
MWAIAWTIARETLQKGRGAPSPLSGRDGPVPQRNSAGELKVVELCEVHEFDERRGREDAGELLQPYMEALEDLSPITLGRCEEQRGDRKLLVT